MPFVVANYVYASSQGQRTHSARTNLLAPVSWLPLDNGLVMVIIYPPLINKVIRLPKAHIEQKFSDNNYFLKALSENIQT